MATSGDNDTSPPANSTYNPPSDYGDEAHVVVSALFSDTNSASAAIRELRDIGVLASNISVISRGEDGAAVAGLPVAAGMAREEVRGEGHTYRASSELPNDEDLPTTAAEMTGSDVPIVTDWEVPPNEPIGGSDRLGLPRDGDMVRRNEADTNADEDIYTDFPDQPGGVSPDSPAADAAAANTQEPSARHTSVATNAATGAGIGAVAGLLAGLAGLAIPGVGPFIAAGPLAGVLSGVITGGAAGGIIGALSGIGVPDEYARAYAAGIEQGQTLVSVHTDSLSRDHVERVLTANGGEQVR
jgi:hypothetical protein